MTQLIKLKDCISRYELNMFHYSTQYNTLKQRRWAEWEQLWKESTLYNKDEMKKKFRQMLLQFQIKWATSTLKNESNEPDKLTASEKFKFFMDEFPDTYMFMLQPVFKLDKALTEAEVMLFGPNRLYCISYIENSRNSIISVQKSNFWTQTTGNKETKILNPYLAVNRMSEIVKSVYGSEVYEYPVEYIVMAPHGYIEYDKKPTRIMLVDQRNLEDWVNKLAGLRDPIKFRQLKAAEKMLEHCESNFYKRDDLA